MQWDDRAGALQWMAVSSLEEKREGEVGVALYFKKCVYCVNWWWWRWQHDKIKCLLVKISYWQHNQDKQSDETPYKLVAVVAQSTVLVLMGNFHLLDVCCNTAEKNQRLPVCVKDTFLTHLVNEPTRGTALPDLSFVNIERLMGDVRVPWKAVLKKKGPRKSGNTWRKKAWRCRIKPSLWAERWDIKDDYQPG